MKFLSITYRKFGPFDERTLDLSANPANMHIIFGPNEAGKTTALKGLTYFLFGFPTRTCHDFRFKSSEQRIGAHLLDGQGRDLQGWRKRGTKNTLRALDDKTPLPGDPLRDFLAGLGEDQFTMLFGLDYANFLKEGGKIIEGQGGLGEALFAAGAGLTGLRKTDQRLSERLEALYKPRGQNQEIPKTLEKLRAEADQLRQTTIAVEAWLAQRDHLNRALDQKKNLEADRARLRSEISQLERFRFALPTIAAMKDFEDQLRPLSEAATLPENFADLYRSTLSELEVAKNRHVRAAKELAKLEVDLAALSSPAVVLAEEDAIKQLIQEFGAILKAEKDQHVTVLPQISRYEGGVHQLLRDHFGRETLDNIESLRISKADQKRIGELGKSRGALLQTVCLLQEQVNDLAKQSHTVDQSLDLAPPYQDHTRLEALIREISQEGPLEKTFRDGLVTLKSAQDRVNRDVAKLAPAWRGTLAQVPLLTPLSPERIAFFESAFTNIDRSHQDAEKSRALHAKAIRETQRKIESLEQSGHVPDEAELRTARHDRDAGFDRLITASVPTNRSTSEDAGHAVKAQIHLCDGMSDRMRHAAARVSELIHLSETKKAAQEEFAVAEEQLKAATIEGETLTRQWAEEWRHSGVQPAPPSEMRSWLRQWSTLRDQADALVLQEQTIVQKANEIERLKAELRAAPELAGVEQELPLSRLLEFASTKLELARANNTIRADLAKTSQTARESQKEAQTKLNKAQDEYVQWRGEWERAVAVIGLRVEDEPSKADLYLEHLNDLHANLHEIGVLRTRLASMDRDRVKFLGRLDSVRARLSGDASIPSTMESAQIAVDDLGRLSNDARRIQADRQRMEGALAEAKREFDEADQSLTQSRTALQTLCEQANVSQLDQVPAAIRQAERRRELEKYLAEERRKLREQTIGQPLDEFRAAAIEARETLEEQFAVCRERVDPLDQAISQQAIEAEAARRQILDWEQATATAAESRQRIESILVELRDHVTEYAALHLARQILKRTIERYRAKHEDSLLSRAGHFFRLLTNNAFRGLDVDEDEKGQTVMLAWRASGDEKVPMAGLSDGTRDQLFLALRLAGIEQHLRQSGPMPLIVDDLLVNFDDERSVGTLKCLAELSRQTQVLLFTHHAHVVALAKTHLSSEMLVHHDLAPAGLASGVPILAAAVPVES